MTQYTENDPELLKCLSNLQKAIDSRPGKHEIKDGLKNNFSGQVISGYLHDGCLPSTYTICTDGNGELTGFGIGYGKLDDDVCGGESSN